MVSTPGVNSKVSAFLVLSKHTRLSSLWIPLVLTSEKNDRHQICMYHRLKMSHGIRKLWDALESLVIDHAYEKLCPLIPLLCNYSFEALVSSKTYPHTHVL